MSNLSDLLPAGASAKSIEAVASGTLSSGDAVGLNADGTVTEIGSAAPVPQTIPDGVAQAYNSSSMNISSIAFDPNTASLQIFETRNFNTRFAGILMASPV